jgi:hypothetical protein
VTSWGSGFGVRGSGFGVRENRGYRPATYEEIE